MPVQQIGLDYSWLLNLADIISRGREKQQPKSQISAVPGSAQISGGATGGMGGMSLFDEQREMEKAMAVAKAEKEEAEAGRTHELALKQMDVDSALAQVMAQERASKYSADIGLKGVEAKGTTDIAVAQKTSKEKGKELVEMLWAMDKPSRDEIIALMEAKDQEALSKRGGSISSGTTTIPMPGSKDRPPGSPLALLEDAGVYNTETGLADPAPKGVTPTPQKLSTDLTKQIDTLFDQDMRIMPGIVKNEAWDLLEGIIRDTGASGQYPEDIIEGEVNRRRAIYDESVKRNQPTDTGEPTNIITEVIHQLRHPEEGEEVTKEMSDMYKSGAGAYDEIKEPIAASDIGRTVREFMETIFTGPFHPAYEKWKDKRTGKAVGETLPKEVGEITEQDAISTLGAMSKEQIKEFQTVAKAEGSYTGPINGLHSNELDNAMKKYFKKHKSEFSSTGSKKKVTEGEEEEEEK